RLWNTDTGKHKATLTGHIGNIYSIAFSPDGSTIASAGDDQTIRLWNAATGQHKTILIGHTNAVVSVAYSPDGGSIASGSWDKTVRLWDAVTGTHLQTLVGHTDSVTSVSFDPTGNLLASGGSKEDNTIRLWKLSSPHSVQTSSTPPKPTANQVYDNAIRSVMWIVNPGVSEGSGGLIDKKFRLAVTNTHVTGKQNLIDVYFPAPDENGDLIKDRNFYLTSKGVLKRLGYYTKGHVVARNEETDLAIIRLDGLPETVREIDWHSTTPTTNAGDLVYILGNPGGQDLWRWTLGEYLKDHGDFLHLQSDVFGGNSGGPVLNKQGILIGIVARSDRHMNALAIPVRDLNRLLSESQLKHSRSLR
ncbi:MAG: LpqB family beta-propeller domain-containing protein, partial [Candidatus Poribacteria bacterium]|nr:LpqB family beta-propeller domain-containing protein [Candidatus Poribacteria bacterium]